MPHRVQTKLLTSTIVFSQFYERPVVAACHSESSETETDTETETKSEPESSNSSDSDISVSDIAFDTAHTTHAMSMAQSRAAAPNPSTGGAAAATGALKSVSTSAAAKAAVWKQPQTHAAAVTRGPAHTQTHGAAASLQGLQLPAQFQITPPRSSPEAVFDSPMSEVRLLGVVLLVCLTYIVILCVDFACRRTRAPSR